MNVHLPCSIGLKVYEIAPSAEAQNASSYEVRFLNRIIIYFELDFDKIHRFVFVHVS